MTDRILKHLGLKLPLGDEAYEVVVDHLCLFKRAGGIVDWNLWKSLAGVTRAALVDASEIVKAEESAAIGLATQGPKQAAGVLSAADGGDLFTELILDEFSEKMAATAKK